MNAVNRAVGYIHQDTNLAPRVVVNVTVPKKHFFISVADSIYGVADLLFQGNKALNIGAEFTLHVDDFANDTDKWRVGATGMVYTLTEITAGNT